MMFFSKGVSTHTKPLCDLSQVTLGFGQAEPAGLKEEQMCRANLHTVLVQPQTTGS